MANPFPWTTGATAADPSDHNTRHENAGADEISVEGLAVTSLAMSAHSAAVTGIHGAGTGTIAVAADITTHAALTTVHSLGSMAQAASADYASTTVYAAHTATDGSHGAGTIASIAAATALITTHAGLTATHGIAGTIA